MCDYNLVCIYTFSQEKEVSLIFDHVEYTEFQFRARYSNQAKLVNTEFYNKNANRALTMYYQYLSQ